MNTARDSTTDQDESSSSAAASFAHSLSVAPLDTANTIHNISLALNGGDSTGDGDSNSNSNSNSHDDKNTNADDFSSSNNQHTDIDMDTHNNGIPDHSNSSIPAAVAADPAHVDTDVLMTDVTNAVQNNIAAMQQAQNQHQHQHQHQHKHHQHEDLHHLQQPPAESRMAVAELLVSLAQNSNSNLNARGNEEHAASSSSSLSAQDAGAAAAAYISAATSASGNSVPTTATGQTQQSPIYRNAENYVGSVRKAYENNPKVYTEFLSALEQYHGMSMTIETLVRTVMSLFQDQPDLLLGFKEFLPEAQGLLNQLVPPMMYSDYKGNMVKLPGTSAGPTSGNSTTIPAAVPASPVGVQQASQMFNNNGQNQYAAADFLSLIKERSQQEPDMYQHMITLLRKFQKDHNYANLYFYVSIILRYHPHLLQRFHHFLPSVVAGVEVAEPRVISKAPPEELVVSPDFIEAKDFVQTVKLEAKNDLSMYDRFIFALEKYQGNGWTLDQVYSEVSLIFWNHPDALIGFKQFISSVPPPPTQP